ncbi:thiamine-repressible mitochondrial transport protein THI74 isoform X2 [Cryptomeria japonica]|uniref:thiamine-repressible mitochondrial transport protein THI74 isoform X2 n=1 Tax=Cryptomeria japonica TaxID=3369 RepID=UPI0025ABF73F|nr:thiamine-repressible mitochondrial transport protein THI74 isoform X2 [Cryptomeria japonica]
MQSQTWRWTIGIIDIIAVALIWIAASFVVQSVVDGGVSPFLITYICNSLFVIYIPIVEIGHCLRPAVWKFWSNCAKEQRQTIQLKTRASEHTSLLQDGVLNQGDDSRSHESCSTMNIEPTIDESEGTPKSEDELVETERLVRCTSTSSNENINMDPSNPKDVNNQRHWTRTETAKISLLICPFWFLAQLTFNLSLKYTTVTSNTILSSTSSLFTFLVSLAILDEKFTWVKLSSVLLCMVGTVIVGLGDSGTGESKIAKWPLLGLLDNVLSDYLWAKAVLLTTPTVATAGLSIQVPLAAIIDSLRGNLPHLLDYVGGAAVLVGFFGIIEPITCCASTEDKEEAHIHCASQNSIKQDTGDDVC